MSILKSILCKIATFAGPRQFITFCSTIRTQLHVRTSIRQVRKCSLSFSEGRTNFSLANTVKAAIRLFLCDERYFLKSSRLAREPRRRAKFLMFCGFLRTTIYALLSGVNNNQPPFSLSSSSLVEGSKLHHWYFPPTFPWTEPPGVILNYKWLVRFSNERYRPPILPPSPSSFVSVIFLLVCPTFLFNRPVGSFVTTTFEPRNA